ncbi:hypothetical protein HDU78_006814 [Chytriomyces hyalinus]|nr:hypothetical protein HDU78_006814 [Chytriomyces hyalinus]
MKCLIKLGGAAITAKSENSFKLETETIANAVANIRDALRQRSDTQIIIVCGVGPFGHTNVVRHNLRHGVKTPEQLAGLKETLAACRSVAQHVIDAACALGVSAVLVSGELIAKQANGAITHFDTLPFENALAANKIPVIYGTMVPDSVLGYSVMSGDESIAELAKWWRPDLILLGSNVDGIYTKDPVAHPDSAELIPRIDGSNLAHVLDHSLSGSSAAVDVTGGMKGKIEKLVDTVGDASAVVFRLDSCSNRLFDGLVGEHIEGSTFIHMTHMSEGQDVNMSDSV